MMSLYWSNTYEAAGDAVPARLRRGVRRTCVTAEINTPGRKGASPEGNTPSRVDFNNR